MMFFLVVLYFTLNVDVDTFKRLGHRASLITQDSFSTCCWRWFQVVYRTVIDVDLLPGAHHKLNLVHD